MNFSDQHFEYPNYEDQNDIGYQIPQSRTFEPEEQETSDNSLQSPQSNTEQQVWSPTQDRQLEEWVAENGPRKWISCARVIQGKSDKQCLRRWKELQGSQLKFNNSWTEEEDEKLSDLYTKYGNSWKKYIKYFEGRTELQIKKRADAIIKNKKDDVKKKVKIESQADNFNGQQIYKKEFPPPPSSSQLTMPDNLKLKSQKSERLPPAYTDQEIANCQDSISLRRTQSQENVPVQRISIQNIRRGGNVNMLYSDVPPTTGDTIQTEESYQVSNRLSAFDIHEDMTFDQITMTIMQACQDSYIQFRDIVEVTLEKSWNFNKKIRQKKKTNNATKSEPITKDKIMDFQKFQKPEQRKLYLQRLIDELTQIKSMTEKSYKQFITEINHIKRDLSQNIFLPVNPLDSILSLVSIFEFDVTTMKLKFSRFLAEQQVIKERDYQTFVNQQLQKVLKKQEQKRKGQRADQGDEREVEK